MPTDRAFRVSTYLSFALACAALGYAELAYFPEASAVAALAVVSLGVLYRVEPRLRLLSLADANLLGLALGLAALVWAGVRVVVELRRDALGADVPWQTFVMALVGPVLLAVIPAKLLRREKHAGDYLGLHAAGLAAVALGCAMADDGGLFLLVGVYLAVALGALGVLFLARAAGRVAPVPPGRPAPPVAAAAVDAGPGGRAFRTGAIGLLAATAAAVPLFLLTPRSAGVSWEVGKPRIEVGFAADQMLDLNRTGTLRVNPEVAFTVAAERAADGSPVTDLPPEALWRGVAYADYAAGAWRAGNSKGALVRTPTRMVVGGAWEPPPLGPAAVRLTFAVPAKLKAAVLADPVAWVPGGSPPVASVADGRVSAWYQASPDGTFHRKPDGAGAATLQYVQVTAPPPEPGLGPGFDLAPPPDSADALRPLRAVPPRIKDIGDGILDRLIAVGELPKEVRTRRNPIDMTVREEYHEAVARAVCRFLGPPGGFTYSLKIDRKDKALDPVEDFLLNTKAGHCERFATALVVLLRAQGIPGQVVLGFRGCEHVGDGVYEVRHDHAHEWAEVLVPRPAPPGGRGPVVYHWLTLDPAPDEDQDDPTGGTWVGRTTARGKTLYADYVSGYGSDQRQRTLAAAGRALARWEWLAALAAVAVGVAAFRFRRAGAAAGGPPSPEAAWFGRVLAVLAPHGHNPDPGETPREFAARVSAALSDRGDVAAVPVRWADAYYAARFGGRPLSPEARADLDAGLGELKRALG